MSRAPVIAAAAVAALAGAAGPARARELLGPPGDGAAGQRVYALVSVDPTFASGLGYARAVPVAALGRAVELSVDLSAPWFVFDGRHYRLDAGARTRLLGTGAWRAAGRLHVALTGGRNWVHTATGVGFEASLVAGRYRPCWYAAAELSVAHDSFTYLVHRDGYRSAQYAGAVDGWYWNTGGRVAVAVEAGRRLGRAWEVNARVGYYASLTLAPPQGAPLFADLAVARRL